MKTQEVPPILRGFFKVFNSLSYRHDYSQIFADFLTLAMCCFAWQTEEKIYLETVKRYDRKELDLFAQLLAEWLMIHAQKSDEDDPSIWFDALGTFYELLRANYGSNRLGQFFTPEGICTLMARLTYRNTAERQTICDPCSGSGRLLLAMNAQAPGQHYYYAGDLDSNCVKMTCLNLFIHGVRGRVLHMNTLTQEYFGGYEINKSPLLPSIIRLRAEEAEKAGAEIKKNLEINF